MFGRKKKAQKREEHQQSLRKGLLFWLPGGSSRLDVYVDYCVIRCLGKTKMKEKERVIPFTSIQDVVSYPAHRHAAGLPAADHQRDAGCEEELLVCL
ncbi:MAG: hypothetical protein ACLR1T_13370 [Evtepia gabavorous]